MANVTIANRLSQVLLVSTDDGASVSPLRLEPKGVSDPINEEHLTDYTRNLAAAGHVLIRPVA